MERWATIGLVAGVLLLAACASGPGASPSQPPAQPAPASPAATPRATPAPTAAASPPSTPSAGGTSSSDILAKGKLVFEKTAGGVGCASCHGLDGKGGVAGVGAPDIRGAKEARVRGALAGGVPLMSSFIKLDESEVTAVVAYLQELNK